MTVSPAATSIPLHGILLCGLLTAVGCGKPQSRLEAIEAKMDANDLDAAAVLASNIPPGDPDWPRAQLLLGRIEISRQNFPAAIEYFDSLPHDGSELSAQAIGTAAEMRRITCRLTEAVENFAELVEQAPGNTSLHSRIGTLLVSSGQRYRAEPHLLEFIKHGRFQIRDLVWLSAPERVPDPDPYLHGCLPNNPDDPYVQLGLATEDFHGQQLDSARRRLEAIIRTHPELADAQALVGELALDDDLQVFDAWHAALPESVKHHPGIWFVRGQRARRENQPRVAARCFWEAIRQASTHQRAMYQLGQLVSPLDAPAGAAFATRAKQLKEYTELMESVMIRRGRDEDQFQRMISLLLDMGRDWEAWAWAGLARDLRGTSGWTGEISQSLSYVPRENPPRTRPERNVALLHDLSDWPGFETLPSASVERPAPAAAMPTAIRFEDVAAERGIDFTYFQSHSRDTDGVRMFESTGGGVGVVDFDLDGAPDLFLTQGVEWPFGAGTPASTGRYTDRLFHNRGARFVDVTDPACPGGENGYGQGCSAGDLDNDGFPDLYVANIGANRLLRNNGDGTYSDATQSASITGEDWTTSCLVADLNADGNPDLYDVNYLQGEDIFSIECGANRCSVRGYAGAPDRVQLSQGDGTFRTVPDATPKIDAKGLGIILFQLPGESMPRLFIANDQVPNFFLRPLSSDGRYADDGPSSGLAVNMNGQPNACMGVAAGDVNRDGKLDLFVTNFENEANNLYLQREAGCFEDSIIGSGLMAAGIPYVGWGTQFLDAENDGELDLVVANGHIADFQEPGVEYRMPLQFFRNRGETRFAQLSPRDVGSLFDQKLFGRSLATLDVDGDGRMDFVLSCIESPAILALNRTAEPQHWINVRLHARATARDALGAVVEVKSGSVETTQQLVGGDGFQASNQRMLHFGLGSAETVDRLTVHWPSGAVSDFRNLPADATMDIVEGCATAHRNAGTKEPRSSN